MHQDEEKQVSPHAFAMGEKPAEELDGDPFSGDNLPSELLEPDDRWQNYMVGTRADLARLADEWVVDPSVPEQIARLLQVSRELFVHSYFVHEFAVVAVVWSLLAVEGSIRLALGMTPDDREGLTALIGKAQGRGWLSTEMAERLRAGAQLRNRLVHTDVQRAFTLGMSAPMMKVAHEAISSIWRKRGRMNDE